MYDTVGERDEHEEVTYDQGKGSLSEVVSPSPSAHQFRSNIAHLDVADYDGARCHGLEHKHRL